MNLSIIITTFNSDKHINNCLNSICKDLENSKNYEIIIFDNNSSDDTLKIIRNIQSDCIKIISNKTNQGYSVSINKSVEIAQFQNILILNPDTVIADDAIAQLYQGLLLENIGIVGPKLINSDGSFQPSSRRHFPTLGVLISYFFKLNKLFPRNRFFGKYNYTFIDDNIEYDVDAASGACMMFKKEIFNSVNGFDEKFFMCFEDYDFCIRVKNKGYRIVYYPSAQVTHHNDYSENHNSKIFYFYDSLEKFIYKYKNKIYLGRFIYFSIKIIRKLPFIKKMIYFIYIYKKRNKIQ